MIINGPIIIKTKKKDKNTHKTSIKQFLSTSSMTLAALKHIVLPVGTIIVASKAFIESLDFESRDSRIDYLIKLQIYIKFYNII